MKYTFKHDTPFPIKLIHIAKGEVFTRACPDNDEVFLRTDLYRDEITCRISFVTPTNPYTIFCVKVSNGMGVFMEPNRTVFPIKQIIQPSFSF